MLCERCNKKKSTVFYRENINGRVRALRLCGDCAEVLEQAGELEDMSAAIAGFSSPFFLTDEGICSLPIRLSPDGAVRTGAAVTNKCPLCGATLGEISAKGLLGCARCYEVFGDALADTIRAAHGQAVHTGRTSAGYRVRQERAQRLVLLKQQLREAVSAEQFEAAVGLRDQIRALEAEA